MDTDPCLIDAPEPFVMVPHDKFRQAMELLGLDVDHLFSVSIGPWQVADEELWGLAPLMAQEGAFWRVRATVGMARPTLSDAKVRFVGILSPRAGEEVED